MGRGNERLANIQEQYAQESTTQWLESLERSLAMMKEYQVSPQNTNQTYRQPPEQSLTRDCANQAARKKLESRRLALDTSTTKMQKAKRDDFRVEEELRTAKAKYEEMAEDVYRRMQDIKEAESDSIRDLTHFMDAELDYHERCAEEMRRVRRSWAAGSSSPADYGGGGSGGGRRPSGRSRSNTADLSSSRLALSRSNSNIYEEEDEADMLPAQNMRVPIRSQSRVSTASQLSDRPEMPAVRPGVSRINTQPLQSERTLGASLNRTTSGTSTPLGGGQAGQALAAAAPPLNVGSLRGQLRPTGGGGGRAAAVDVFGDNDADDTGSSGGSPDFAPSPATSYGSLSRTSTAASGVMGKKAPPPPPPSRAKKPAPPVPVRREVGY